MGSCPGLAGAAASPRFSLILKVFCALGVEPGPPCVKQVPYGRVTCLIPFVFVLMIFCILMHSAQGLPYSWLWALGSLLEGLRKVDGNPRDPILVCSVQGFTVLSGLGPLFTKRLHLFLTLENIFVGPGR